jgi:hypothetical protein
MTAAPTHPETQRLLRRLVCGWVALDVLFSLPWHAQLWGAAVYLAPSPSPVRWLDRLTNVLSLPGAGPFYLAALLGELLCALLAVVGVRPRLFAALTLLLRVNLMNRAPVVLDAGDDMARLLLGYGLLLNPSDRADRRWLSPWTTALSNAAFFALRVQVALVYPTAGLHKLAGALWRHGTAVYLTLQHPGFHHPTFAALALRWPVSTVFATYATLAFQLSFGVLVWFQRWRPWVLGAGVLFHAAIGGLMGLPTFATIMMISYVSFFREAWSVAIATRWNHQQKRQAEHESNEMDSWARVGGGGRGWGGARRAV